ncbi:EamA/RhaT family transporter [Caenimonas terrae]|uniref:EamA/RhaT family transporter n=1 Tax=Caenimonas terrae TaxID=696074 RepID=A0ABW0NFK1_9BURK
MQASSVAAWAWIPIVVAAAAAQTARNAAQRTLTAQVGTLGATLVRFLYGLPFAALAVVVLQGLSGAGLALPAFTTAFFAWVAFGAVSQIAATAFLLGAMKERNFIVAVTYSKTEVLQVALFAALFLHEVPAWLTLLAIGVASAGVVMLSLPQGTNGKPGAEAARGWGGKVAVLGLASGAGFALSAVGYRGAALQLPGLSPWLAAAWGVMCAQALQSLLLGSWLAWRAPQALSGIRQAWRISLLAGGMGAVASLGWFTGFALRPAADVRTLGLVEVLFSYLVSRRLFREKLGLAEQVGLALVAIGLVVVCARL